MMKKRSSAAQKPAVAFRTERRARENILAKKSALERLLVDATPRAMDNFPKSVRQFNLWSSSALPIDCRSVTFISNSPATLRRDPVLLESVKQLIAEVRTPKAGSDSRRNDTVAKLRADKRLHGVLREIAEREVIVARREATRARSKVLELQAQLDSLRAFAAQRVADLESRLSVLEARNAELVATARKVTAISRRG